jgi:hypothetical protein
MSGLSILVDSVNFLLHSATLSRTVFFVRLTQISDFLLNDMFFFFPLSLPLYFPQLAVLTNHQPDSPPRPLSALGVHYSFGNDNEAEIAHWQDDIRVSLALKTTTFRLLA